MLLMRIAPRVERRGRQRGSMWFITKSHSRAQANKAIFAAMAEIVPFLPCRLA